jgi:hypothetical protein
MDIKKIQKNMINDKVKNIVDMLIKSTESGNLQWIECGDKSKRDFQREFYCIGEDGTRYETDVKYTMNSNNGTWQIESNPSLWIKSNKLPNGSFYVYGGTYDLKGLREVLKKKYCSDLSPSEKVVEDALDSISQGISIAEMRDSKLNKILNVFGLSGK